MDHLLPGWLVSLLPVADTVLHKQSTLYQCLKQEPKELFRYPSIGLTVIGSKLEKIAMRREPAGR